MGIESLSSPATFGAVVLRLVGASAVAALIGVNRELRQKPAGLRTHALVGLGSAVFTLIGLSMTSATSAAGAGDPSAASRVLQGIVAGIGFIGGGVILHRDDSQGVHGLSTAASIWVVAAAGIGMGGGMWRTALVTVVLALIILAGGAPIDQALRRARLRSTLSNPSQTPETLVDTERRRQGRPTAARDA